MKRKAAEHYGVPVRELPAAPVLAAAATGGVAYWVAVFPLDVIKSSMQADSINKAQRKYPTITATTQVPAPCCCFHCCRWCLHGKMHCLVEGPC